jgi:hypothetical protein
MKKSGIWVWAVVLVGFSWATQAADDRQSPATAKPSLTVTVVTPQTASMAQKISANGNLAAWQEAIIGAEANGLKITEVRVNVGDRVQRGDVLATLAGRHFARRAGASRRPFGRSHGQCTRSQSPVRPRPQLAAAGLFQQCATEPDPGRRCLGAGACAVGTRHGAAANRALVANPGACARCGRDLGAPSHSGQCGGRGHRVVPLDSPGPHRVAR